MYLHIRGAQCSGLLNCVQIDEWCEVAWWNAHVESLAEACVCEGVDVSK